jgi:ATP-dependent DNA ligase
MTSQLPTLYKHKNNKLRIWNIKVNTINNKVFIITEYGMDCGKMVTSQKEVKKGKGKNNVFEQALADATSKWKAKTKKEGFSIDRESNKVFITPMLAHTFNPDTYNPTSRAKNITFPAMTQRKYDGIRCITNKTVMLSRNQTVYAHLDHIEAELHELLQNKSNNFYIDGELYTDEYPFEVLSGLINTKIVTEDTQPKIHRIEYHIYDCFDLDNMKLTYEERLQELNNLFNTHEFTFLKHVDTDIINSVDDVIPMHNMYVEEGFEGIMLRNITSPYEFKRSKNLQKYKSFFEEEFKIIGFKEGTGTERGTVVWECETSNKKHFSVRPRGTFEMRKQLLQNGDQYIGQMLTVRFQEYSNLGIPRFPVGKAIRLDN